MILAIDGPAASGKGTLAKRLAAYYGLPHLDTGLLYRATARALMDEGLPLEDAAAAELAALCLDPSRFDEARLRGASMGEAASIVAAMPGVRSALIGLQRAFADQPGGAVLDGRDIGTVIAPHADVKIFVTASPQERARRRHAELASSGPDAPDYEQVLSDILRRDARDSGRGAAPLQLADDAILLDSTFLDRDAVFKAAIDCVEERLRGSSS